jgi:chloramphenicol-sensitive protein RarD
MAGPGAFLHEAISSDVLLVGAGVVTAIPLLLFAAGARRLKLATVGLIQYIGPTIQLALGVLLFGEPFDRAKLAGFSLIWLALLLYSAAGLWQMRAQKRAAAAEQGLPAIPAMPGFFAPGSVLMLLGCR